MTDAEHDDVGFYAVRDLLIGDNYVESDVSRALELAAESSHPLAKWLTQLFRDRRPGSRNALAKVKCVLLSSLAEGWSFLSLHSLSLKRPCHQWKILGQCVSRQ